MAPSDPPISCNFQTQTLDDQTFLLLSSNWISFYYSDHADRFKFPEARKFEDGNIHNTHTSRNLGDFQLSWPCCGSAPGALRCHSDECRPTRETRLTWHAVSPVGPARDNLSAIIHQWSSGVMSLLSTFSLVIIIVNPVVNPLGVLRAGGSVTRESRFPFDHKLSMAKVLGMTERWSLNETDLYFTTSY